MPELDQRFSKYATRICWQTVQPFGHVKSGYFLIRFFHTSHNAPYVSPKILHNLCFSFLLGIATVPKGIENNAYEKFWGANKVHYGRCANGVRKKNIRVISCVILVKINTLAT